MPNFRGYSKPLLEPAADRLNLLPFLDMKRLWAHLLLFVFLTAEPAAASFSAPVQKASGGPRVVMEKTRHDFGEVFAGEVMTKVFAVRNAGTLPLELAEKTAQPAKTAGRMKQYFFVSGYRTVPIIKRTRFKPPAEPPPPS